jgi:hypothetical protein
MSGIRSDSDAIPGASRLRNQNEILIEKSDEAVGGQKTRVSRAFNSPLEGESTNKP